MEPLPPLGPPRKLQEAAQQAVLTSPQVLARWYAMQAAGSERDVALGALRPRVDLSAALGPQRRGGSNPEVSRGSASLSITQLLYDGQASRNEARRLDHAARVRLFEFLDASEQVALEATRAWVDVARFRQLASLAESNHQQHRLVQAQVQDRVAAGVGREVDLEQVTGRLALTRTNASVAAANLHDAVARYARAVGEPPPAQLVIPDRPAGELPLDAAVAWARAQAGSPALQAAVENVRAAHAAVAARRGDFGPRVDARLRHDHGRDTPGPGQSQGVTAAELVLNWNLFNGLANRARERQFVQELHAATAQRDQVCRDVRQAVSVAWNDALRLQERMEDLHVHERSVTRALDAYRAQFEIGQRTLLDLLDTENELHEARRARVNAEHDLHIAFARLRAAQGELLRALGLRRLDAGDAAAPAWGQAAAGAQHCAT